MEEEDFEGCISCMQTNDLCDLFSVYAENSETYAKLLESCFNIKVANDLKYICAQCVQKLEDAVTFKEQTTKSMAMLHGIKDEEYLDEALLEEDEVIIPDLVKGTKVTIQETNYGLADMDGDSESMKAVEENQCIYCDMVLPSLVGLNNHIRVTHGLQPRDDARGPRHECELCAAVFHTATTLREHMERCHGVLRPGDEGDDVKQFPCHFCENIYSGRKACYTHLRMKHGLKLSTEKAAKLTPRIRKKCHICNKDFSQKQILNKHLWKEHGYEVEKRKAFVCPLCDERVSYGHHFDQHLVSEHRLKQHVELLQFPSMDDFMIYKSQIQEESKCRFRKTTASKHTIEGLRSHYMCSQSGVYVYQGKGIRPAPERQIYKTGKACPAHMIVTESVDCVRVTFHSTHVGHGACPYYEPREPRKLKQESPPPGSSMSAADLDLDRDREVKDERDNDNAGSVEAGGGAETDASGEEAAAAGGQRGWMCEACGLAFLDDAQFREHAARHGARHLCPCHYCPDVFQNADAWTRHLRTEHNVGTLF